MTVKLPRARVALLAAGVILCAAPACAKTEPESPQVGTGKPAATAPPSTSGSTEAAESGVPAVAWINADALPLNDSDRWPALADVAQPLADGVFEVQTLCGVVPDTTLIVETQSARAHVDRGADAWSLQQQIVHYSGDSWRQDQMTWTLFENLIDTVTNCESHVPGSHVAVTTADSDCEHFRPPCSQFAATIDVPGDQVVAHVYLSSVAGSVTELSVRASGNPRRPWSAPGDAEVFTAMTRQLCKAWRCASR